MNPVSAPIDMEAFENAVHRWFFDATEIETIWAIQGKTMPEYPVGVLQIIAGPIAAPGQWEVRNVTNLSRPAGQEIAQTAAIQCTFTVSCQAWVGGDDRWHPEANARHFMMIAQAALRLPSYLEAFRVADISVVRTGGIQDISSVQENEFVSKVNMDVTFGAVLNVTEYNTYIEKIHGTSEFTGTDFEIDREFGDI